MLISFLLSFTDYPVITAPKWVGFDNYVEMLTDDKLVWQSLKVTLLYSLGAIPLALTVAFFVAMLLATLFFRRCSADRSKRLT